ncbi:MAG: hypothetical protein HY074_20550 [Deltaproteobacteria bacterium]|nr:hypothetical protein [Deltaproteobacteria bacterium]
MKVLVISGSHEVVVAQNEQDARRAREQITFDRVVRLDEERPAQSNVVAFPGQTASQNTDLNAQVDELESRLITEVMAATGNNQIKAAARLRITRGALQYKLKKYAAKKLQQAA